MVKRTLAFICMLSLILTATPVFAVSTASDSFYTEVSLDDISEISMSNTNVLELSPTEYEVLDEQLVADQLTAFLNNHGLIVYRDDDGITLPILDEYLNLPAQESARSDSNSIELHSESDQGKDIAIIYYLDNQGAVSTHTINVASNDNDYSFHDSLVDDAIYQIAVENDSQGEEAAVPSSADSVSGDYLGTKKYTYARPPKGKLVAEYEFHTAQNVNGKDHYIVFGDINGIPGEVLCNDDGSYAQQYEGEQMVVDISPVTSSVELDDYGPDRTITSSAVSYGVDITAGLDGITITHSVSYTRNISDTEVATKCTSTDARWELALYDPAQSDNCRFEPAATFVCSSAKSSVTFDCFASYTLDSEFTAEETIDLSRTLTCTASRVSEDS